TIDLFEAAAALGAKRENIFALGKIYSNSPLVIGALRDRGVTVVQSTPPEPLRHYAVSSVEQTSLGTFLFEEKPPPFAVMSWARAAVKLQIGGPLFSQCFIDCLHTEFLHSRTLQGEQLGVIGMGSIGRAVAKLAVRQGNELFYYDPNTDLHLPPHLRDV